MNQKGFATIFGLCLILVIALIVKGIQEFEMNHAHETANFETELELQNAADVGIFKAAAEIKDNPENLPLEESFKVGEILVKVNSVGTDAMNYTLNSSAEIGNELGKQNYRRAVAVVSDNVIHFTK